MTKNREIAGIFERMATLLEIKGENAFKIRAYQKAAENIDSLAEDIAVLRAEERFDMVGGLGPALREKIGEFLDTGKVSAYEKLIGEIPESVLDVVTVPSVGPKKAKLFYDQLGVKSVDDLKDAAQSGKLAGLPGIREKTVANILKGIEVVGQGQERMNLGTASRVAGEIIASLENRKGVDKISAAGSLRRMKETIRDIDIIVGSSQPAAVMEAFIGLPNVKSVNSQGQTKSSILTEDNVQVDLRVVPTDIFGAALLYFTGSTNFNVRLRQIAKDQDKKVNEYGVFSVKGSAEKYLAGRTEQECLKELGLPYISPELREDIGDHLLFGDKAVSKLPELIELKDIRGEFHVHSTWSDGKNSIEEMANAARERGYEYLAVSDHSMRLRVANGLSPEALKKKRKEIDRLNEKMNGFRILMGSEVEIDLEGNIDYNEEILSRLDIVIASIHTGFEQPREKQTLRLVRAIRNKHVDIIAHPTGVHLGKRPPYDINLKEVCRAAVDSNTFLEINSFPVRLDLNAVNVFFAREQGVRFVVNTDAHAVQHLDYMKFGVATARRGWLTKNDVLNTKSLKEILKELAVCG